MLLRVAHHRQRERQRNRDVSVRPSGQKIFGKRAVRTDRRKIQLELVNEARGQIGAASGDEDDAHACGERAAQRLPVRLGDAVVFVEQRAVEIECDEIDSRTHDLQYNPAAGTTFAGAEAFLLV